MRRAFTVVLAVSFLASAAFAAELTDVAKAVVTADAKVCPAECSKECSKGCPIEAAMAKLPKMTFKVGTEETCCS